MSGRKGKRGSNEGSPETDLDSPVSTSPPDDTHEDIARTLAEQFAHHAELLAQLAADGALRRSEVIHDFRVSTRQLLASLSMVHTIARPTGSVFFELEDVRKKLKKPFKALGPLRDLEVAAERLELLSQQDSTWRALHAVCQSRYEGEAPEVLASMRARRLPRAAEALVVHGPSIIGLVSGVEPAIVGRRLAKELLHRQREARSSWNHLRPRRAATFHELRIALKHLRYESAFIAELSGNHRQLAKSVVSDCRALQQQLGEIQDLTVLLQMARAHADTASRALRALKRQRAELITAALASRPTIIDTLVRARALASALRMERPRPQAKV